MQNPLRLRQAVQTIASLATFGTRKQIQEAAQELLHAEAELDGVVQAQMLASQSKPVHPNQDKEPMDPALYAAGRVLRQLGAEANHHTMRQVYERTKAHADLTEAQRRYNEELATGFTLDGKPPLVDNNAVSFLDTRALIARYSEGAEQARSHAFQAVADRLKAECQTAKAPKQATTKNKRA
jgi:hypothetical protein